MNIFSEFESNLLSWLRKNGANEVEGIVFGLDYEYYIYEHTICIGTENDSKADKWFREYLENKGCKCEGIPDDILSFLHEVGHSCTIHKLMSNDEDFFDDCAVMKDSCYNFFHKKKSFMDYWNIPDELAANNWVVSFVNERRNSVEELCNIWSMEVENLAANLLSSVEYCA